MRVRRALGGCAVGAALLLIALAFTVVPSIAAGGLLHPIRVALYNRAPQGCADREFTGDGLTLRGWHCAAIGQRRGSVVYLHGVADNRSSAVGVIEWFTQRGFDVVAYDSRAHGQSDGSVCTYGFYEKRDLKGVIDSLPPGPIVVMGHSLGGAVAIQGAAVDDRVTGVIAAEAFSDLRTIATERAPWFLPRPVITRAFSVAEEHGHFDADAVNPGAAAASLRIPVLLDSWGKRCRYATGSFEKDSRGVKGTEAIAACSRGWAQSVAKQPGGLGRDRTMAVICHNVAAVPDESPDIERELRTLEAELKRLEAEYNMYFAGRLPRPPWETRKRVEGMVKRIDRMVINNTGHRFRFSTLQSRFTSFVDLWDRGQRSRDEGRPGPFAQPRPVEEKPASQPAEKENRVVHVATFKDPLKEMEKLHELYDNLAEMRRQAGQDSIPFHKFADLVKTQVDQMKDKGTGEVAFRVAMKDGKVAFTARSMKGDKDKK